MPTKRETRMSLNTLWEDEDGAVGILLAVMLPVVAGFTTLAVDMSYVWATQDQLQITADAAALAGTMWVGNNTGSANAPCTGSSASLETAGSTGSISLLCNAAESIAHANAPSGLDTSSAPVLNHADIVLGVWSGTAGCSTAPCGSFTPIASAGTGAIANAVQVTTRLTAANGNAIGLFFTPLLNAIRSGAGFSTFSLTATATAAFTTQSVNPNGEGSNPPISNIIIVQDLSDSFTNTSVSGCTHGELCNAQTAIKDCAESYALEKNENSQFGIVAFTGNSPQAQRALSITTESGSYTVPASNQGGWCPENWNSKTVGNCSPQSASNPSGLTFTGAQSTNPYVGLTTVTSSNFTSTIDTDATNLTSQIGTGVYTHSGSNISAGLQAAINQLCPGGSTTAYGGCTGGTMQVVIITDGISNCENNSGSNSIGTSLIAGQSGVNASGKICPSGSGMTGGNGLLLQNDYNMATYAGSLGITVSTIYYSGEGSGSGPDGKTYSEELEQMTTNANTALQTYAENQHLTTTLSGQFFNEPTGDNVQADMMQICSWGGKPRLVL